MTEPIIQPVIMSGGAGTRLWPLSRKAKPKQFLPLVSERTMVQETALRLSGPSYAPPLAICGADHAGHIKDQLGDVGIAPPAVITEPFARNTAAVAAVAAAWTRAENPGALALLAPADHHIREPEAFRAAVAAGTPAAQDGVIVTFGIKADRPHTGYGYIKKGASLDEDVYRVDAFLEKPSLDKARSYLAEGGFYWNAGIFLFSPEAMGAALEAHAPEINDAAFAALRSATCKDGVFALDAEAFARCPSDSIDCAVMEKTDKAAVVAPVDAGWSDIGSWTETPDGPNAGSVAAIDCANTLIKTDGPFVGAIGLEDMIVVATNDAILIAPRDRAQDVKRIVESLKEQGRDDLL